MAKTNNKYLKRVVFSASEQAKFLNKVQNILQLSSEEVAKIINVHPRTFRDWKREVFLMSLDAAEKLCKECGISLPINIEIKDPFWYVSKGAKKGWLAVIKKYGKIGGDPIYRKEKWYEWWEKEGKFRVDTITATLPFTPPKNSSHLAEAFGIILGDGCITKGQVRITLNKNDDSDFINYVAKLFKKIFGIKPSLHGYKGVNVMGITLSRKKIIGFLVKKGLKIGNKVKQQVEVPDWIRKSDLFSKYCMRGLLDTDGCFYVDKHKYKDKVYFNCGINFTNRSLPILNFFKENLIKFGYHPTQNTQFSISLRREEEIKRYFEEIGSSNPKHLNKFKNYLKERYRSGHNGTASKAASPL